MNLTQKFFSLLYLYEFIQYFRKDFLITKRIELEVLSSFLDSVTTFGKTIVLYSIFAKMDCGSLILIGFYLMAGDSEALDM